eukprot:6458489-Amphidinium_carterae.3
MPSAIPAGPSQTPFVSCLPLGKLSPLVKREKQGCEKTEKFSAFRGLASTVVLRLRHGEHGCLCRMPRVAKVACSIVRLCYGADT